MELPIKNTQPAVSPFAELRTEVRVRPATQPLGESPFHQQAVNFAFFPPSRWRHYFPPVGCPALSRHASPLEGNGFKPPVPSRRNEAMRACACGERSTWPRAWFVAFTSSTYRPRPVRRRKSSSLCAPAVRRLAGSLLRPRLSQTKQPALAATAARTGSGKNRDRSHPRDHGQSHPRHHGRSHPGNHARSHRQNRGRSRGQGHGENDGIFARRRSTARGRRTKAHLPNRERSRDRGSRPGIGSHRGRARRPAAGSRKPTAAAPAYSA